MAGSDNANHKASQPAGNAEPTGNVPDVADLAAPRQVIEPGGDEDEGQPTSYVLSKGLEYNWVSLRFSAKSTGRQITGA